jgi:membrane protease YdiL (CAAX protease family)
MERLETVKFRPIIFIICVFAITWICVIIMEFLDLSNYRLLYGVLDFFESASPLIVSVILLRQYVKNKKNLFRFIFGYVHKWYNYLIVLILFILQFLNFYLFKINNEPLNLMTFVITFIGQILFGGGLEEAGWRGYLNPALEKKLHIIPTVIIVALIWMIWHLPYFILPNTIHSDNNFIVYTLIGIITAFILTAIYKLTGSILLCTLFHGLQNTVVMTIPANQGHIGFMLFFIGIGIISIIICIKFNNKMKTWYVA